MYAKVRENSMCHYIDLVFDLILFVGVTGLHKQITNRELTLVRSLRRAKQDDKNKRRERENANVKISTKAHHYHLKYIECLHSS